MIRKVSLLVFLFFSFSIASFATIIYVTPSGSGTSNGSSWLNAYPGNSLQIAINTSTTGDEIWVASGIYYTTASSTRSISFNMKNGVSIYGSFAGTENGIAQRNLSNGLFSTLSGEIATASTSDNSYHVIHNTGLNNTALIDGFIIRDGNDNRTATSTDGLGGGIYNNGSGGGNTCSPTIQNCLIINSVAGFGGGVFNNGSSGGASNPILLRCVIATNTATIGGGGIDNFGLAGNSNPIITNCVIYNNVAIQRAGAMYCWGGNNGNANPVVLNTTFVNNSAVDGGGIVSDRLNSSSGSSGNANPSFRNCIFWGNTASNIGPQFFILGGATFNATYTDINLTGQNSPHIISGPGTGTINTNPLFINSVLGAGSDAKWLTADDGLVLQASSPCKDVGDNTGITTTDILSNPRVSNTTVDMGAYEFVVINSLKASNENSDQFRIFPNPAKSIITFNGIESSEGKIKIFNQLGVLVYNLEAKNTARLNVEFLPAGIYTVLLETDKKTVRNTLIIAD